jgi:Uma2 family endonuclease
MRFPRLLAGLMTDFHLWIQGTLHADRRHVFDPDFMLLYQRQQSYKEALPTPADVALMVEVAGSSLRTDAGVKLPIYAKSGIQEYWIADLDREVLVVHRQPSATGYSEIISVSGDMKIAPLAAPEHMLTVREIFA